MKLKLLSILIICFTAISCGVNTVPTDNITFGQAFSHCMSTGSYLTFAIICSIISIVLLFIAKVNYSKNGGTGLVVGLFVVAIVLFFTAWLYRPCEVAANTTVEQALRGVYIGY